MAATFTAPDWFAAPMLCKTTQRETLDAPSDWKGFVAEPKHDGVRCIARADEGGKVGLYSRNGQSYTDHVPHLVAALEDWMTPNSMVDGELAILKENPVNVQGQDVPVTDFNATMRVLGSGAEKGRERQAELGKVSFILYDMLCWSGLWINSETMQDRRADLEQGFPHDEYLTLNPQFTDPSTFGELFDELVTHGIEGIIAKNVTKPYVFDGRPNKTWYKVKAAVTMDMIVSGFTDGGGKYEGLIGTVEFSRVEGKNDDGSLKLAYVGRCSGMTDDLRRDITDNKDKYLGRVIEVKSNELVGSKKYRSPRHPQFVTFRNDKNAEDCTGDELLQTKDDV